MKIENLEHNTYLLGTIKDVCNTIGSIIEKDWKNDKEFVFPAFYFATTDYYPDADRTLRDFALVVESWYGCKSIENTFESTDMATILADYCGGGAASAGSLWLDELYGDVVGGTIASVMIKALEMNESANKDTIILVETQARLPIYSDEELAQLRKKYEASKLQWMIDHGHTLESLVASLAASLEDSGEPLWETYQAWEKDDGFGGETWPSFEKWLENEKKEENQ